MTPALSSHPGFNFNHFTASEVLSVCNDVPPHSILWGNIIPTLQILDELRSELKRPIRLTSAYRTPRYNKTEKVGGFKRSQHMVFTALDFQVIVPNQKSQWQKDTQNILESWRDEKEFKVLCKIDQCSPREFNAKILQNNEGDFTVQSTFVPSNIPFIPLEVWDLRTRDHLLPESKFYFRGGIGRYSSFTHLATRGVNADW